MVIWHKLRCAITLERVIWWGATLLLAGLFVVIGITYPNNHKGINKDAVASTDTSITVETATTVITTGQETATTQSTTVGGKIPLNSATKEQLMSVSGIGEVFAERIIAYRENCGGFVDLSELMNIQGIGEKRYAKWKVFFTLD